MSPFTVCMPPILFLAISPSLSGLFYTLNGNEGLFFTYPLLVISLTYALPMSSPLGRTYSLSCSRILTISVTLHSLSLQLCDRDHIVSDFLIPDEGSPSSHTDIVMFLYLYSTPFLIALNIQFDLLNVIQYSVINIAWI